MTNILNEIKNKLKVLSNPESEKFYLKFFKADHPNGYGYPDRFLGIKVPPIRAMAKEYWNIDFVLLEELIKSKWHEKRSLAVIILTYKIKKAVTNQEKKKIYEFYLRHIKHINNWDLVDISCVDIVGGYLFEGNREILYELVNSKNIWERRISIVSTFFFIRRNDLDDTYKISGLLLNDSHDLIHKAVGWMLRESGKRDEERLKKFLNQYNLQMPRTMLRYAIERFPQSERKNFLDKKKQHHSNLEYIKI